MIFISMKNRLFIIVVLMFFFCGISWAIRYPGDLATVPPSEVSSAIRNPADLATVPPSSIRSGLFRSPNPIDTSGNLVITGNVAGSRYFRGVVPYRATSEFLGELGSSSLDSFLRRSAGSEDIGRYTGAFIPYYSPSATVTTTRPGYYGVFRPLTTRIQGRAVDEMALPSRPYYYDSGISYYSGLRQPYFPISREMETGRPLSMTPQELEKLISGELGRYPQEGEVLDEQYRARMQQFRWDLKQLTDATASRDVPELFELQTPMEQPDEDEQLDVYEQMKQQIDEFQELLEQLAAAEQIREAADGREEPSEEGLHFAGSGPTLRKMPERETSQAKTELGLPPISREMETLQSFQKEAFVFDELSNFELAARAKAILGKHKTFASFSKDKFNQHLRAAEAYLKQGKYYRAADAYTLASIYKPDDPLAYAGKSHALFAAGEYMSSALFLSRALRIFPEYARFKIDIVAMVGDIDKLENRIVDIKEWQERSDSAELQFLLAYIYYQMGRLEPAKEAIDKASEKMPDAPAVLAVKKAIEEHKNSE